MFCVESLLNAFQGLEIGYYSNRIRGDLERTWVIRCQSLRDRKVKRKRKNATRRLLTGVSFLRLAANSFRGGPQLGKRLLWASE